MTEREAFIAAIAADPGDDTARLAFADWLQEHGEDARAEYVRLACERARRRNPPEEIDTYPNDSDPESARYHQLLMTHWPEWFGPILTAVGMPAPGPQRRDIRYRNAWLYDPYVLHPHDVSSLTYLPIKLAAEEDAHSTGRLWEGAPAFLGGLMLDRGFVNGLFIRLAHRTTQSSLPGVFQFEPIDQLHLELDSNPAHWAALTHPRLRQVQALHLSLPPDDYGHAENESDFTTATEHLLNDPHLVGVRDLHFPSRSYNGYTATLGFSEAGALMRSAVVSRCVNLTVCLHYDSLGYLTDSPALPVLRTLRLATSTLSEFPLSLNQYRDQLEEVRLSDSPVELIGFGRGQPWTRLRRIELIDDRRFYRNIEVVADPTMFPALTELVVFGNKVSGNAVLDANTLIAAIISNGFPRLEVLTIYGLEIVSLLPLAEAVATTNIRKLDVRELNRVPEVDYDRARAVLGDRILLLPPLRPPPPDPDVIPF